MPARHLVDMYDDDIPSSLSLVLFRSLLLCFIQIVIKPPNRAHALDESRLTAIRILRRRTNQVR
jgi:hypothetical protein